MKRAVALSLAAICGSASAVTVTLNPVADTFVAHRAGNAADTANFGTSGELDVLQFGSGIYIFAYLRFDLSSIPAGATIGSASLTLTKVTNTTEAGSPTAARNDTLNGGRFATYGLLDVAGNTPQTWGETTLSFAGTSAVGLERNADTNLQFDTTTRTISLDDAAGNEVISGGTTATISGSGTNALVLFLQGRIDATTNADLATFIVDFPTADAAARGYAFGSREAASGQPVLSVTYTVVPEPTAAALGGLGLLALLRRRRA